MARPSWMKDKTLIDADEPLSISVNSDDVEHAVPKYGDSCVAANCINRAFGATGVYVYRSKAYVLFDKNDKYVYRYSLPQKMVKNVIVPLDNGDKDKIKTGRYTLTPPPPMQALGVDRTPKNPGTRPKREGEKRRMLGRIHRASEI